MKLYTKTGDDGTTGLFGGRRVRKDDPRVQAYGDVDELNAAIGVAIAGCDDAGIASNLKKIQSDLFTLGAELATPSGQSAPTQIHDDDAEWLEGLIDEASAELPPLKNFVLPGGSAAAAQLHWVRAVCRRAERSVVHLAQESSIRPVVVIYLNRLSDLLFAWGRLMNHRRGVAETPWSAPRE